MPISVSDSSSEANAQHAFLIRPPHALHHHPGMVQYLQFRYQKGVLYRLKALGERHNMDITIEGFHSWMWRGLSFLLPFLFAGYVFQAYNAYVLYHISRHPDATWQVLALSIMFAVLFVGNTVTTLLVVPQKMREQVKERYRLMSVSWSLKTRQQLRVCIWLMIDTCASRFM